MQIIFALHLSGVSSLLGAINFGWVFTFIIFLLFNYYSLESDLLQRPMCTGSEYNSEIDFKLKASVFCFYKQNNSGSNIDPKKKDWGLILVAAHKKGNSVYAHELAKAQISSGKPVTLKVLNEILSYSNILVSEDIFNSLINMPKLYFNNLVAAPKKETIKLIEKNLGLPHSKVQQRGVYIFTCKKTNQKYVGSSNQLALRLRGYLKAQAPHREIGKLIPLINKLGLSNFSLEVTCLPYYPDIKPEIVLEQYYLLDPSFNLNTIRVSNNPSGSTAKPFNLSYCLVNKIKTCQSCTLIYYNIFDNRRLGNNSIKVKVALFHWNRVTNASIYMYNRDMSILYYVSKKSDYVNNLGIHYATLEKKMDKDYFYLGKYKITLTPPRPETKYKIMSQEDVKVMLNKDRLKYRGKKADLTLSNNTLHPYYITGFIDGDGSFMVQVFRNRTKWAVQASFVICLHEKDRFLLESIQSYFKGVGGLYKGLNSTIQYRVSLRDDLIHVIIPHFEKYPLLTQKWVDYKIFKSIIELMDKKEHTTPEGLNKVLSLKASMNKGLSVSLIKAFPSITPVDKLKAPVSEIIDPQWVVGFTEAEGCFMIKISKSLAFKLGVQVQLKFQITQNYRDKSLINKLVTYLGCGVVEEIKEGQAVNFVVTKFSDISGKVLPFFDEYTLKGFKLFNYIYFKQGVEILKKKEHLTSLGLESIKKIKEKMNL